ncbi:pyridoxal phosphate-dependent transferase [Zychaea mexicana]|uniref:pyridoxal phosphate-dependent transferase n=1 Tax=Zychaea mexicana TaxID=64656 RepID=UPI0022FEE6C5|nr:pyridoxal phosphate-dependent transferase [Zychaea mexicana]KAI9484956.1 pyridoxal phosphate-dependent transferase [Zychaea mexicana]
MVSNKEINNSAAELDGMLKRMHEMVLQHVKEGQDLHAVVDYKTPAELYKTVDFALPERGTGVDGTFDLIKDTLNYSVNSWNPRFMDKLYAGTNPIGVISEFLLGVLNGNCHVYHVSPVLTLMEVEVTKAVGQLLGMGQHANGLFCPGGSASNLLAMVTARNKLYPSIKTTGYIPRPFNPSADYGKLKVFTSAHCHYSIDKAALVLGLGTDSIVKVPTDEKCKMRVDALERLIQESIERGETPFFINATAGTTVMGAFDPIQSISAVAKKYNCWLHVDGSWGGSAIFSQTVREQLGWLDGSNLADSFTMNPHKLLGVPLQCSMVVTPHEMLFPKVNTLAADYLFHGNPYDLGAGTIGCGRRPDALKIFLAWKFYGRDGLGQRIDRAIQAAADFTDLVREREHFELVTDPSLFCQVCFWYVPKEFQSQVQSWRAQQPEVWKAKMTRVIHLLHERVNHSGDFLVDHAPLDTLPHFFRIVINAPTVNVHRDLAALLDAIEDASKKIAWNQVSL